jgi:hypothetical protein
MTLGELSDDICNRLDPEINDEGHYFERTKMR